MSGIEDEIDFDPDVFVPYHTANNARGISPKARAHQQRTVGNSRAGRLKATMVTVAGRIRSPITMRKFSWEPTA